MKPHHPQDIYRSEETLEKDMVEDEKDSVLSTTFCKPYVFYIVKHNGIL